MMDEKPVVMIPVRHLVGMTVAGAIMWIFIWRWGHTALRWLVSL